VSIRALFVVGRGRLQAAYNLPEASYNIKLVAAYDKDAVPLSSDAETAPGAEATQKKPADTEKEDSESDSDDDDFAAALEDEMVDRSEANQLVAAHARGGMTEHEASYNIKLVAASKKDGMPSSSKKPKTEHEETEDEETEQEGTEHVDVGSYSVAEAKAAYWALSDDHKINGWGDVYW
jgi:hypothetical protein